MIRVAQEMNRAPLPGPAPGIESSLFSGRDVRVDLPHADLKIDEVPESRSHPGGNAVSFGFGVHEYRGVRPWVIIDTPCGLHPPPRARAHVEQIALI